MPAMSTAMVAVTFSRGPRCGCASSASSGATPPNSANTACHPSHDVLDAEQHLVDRPADDADARHQQAERERRPEQPLAPRPGVATPRDDRDACQRRQQQRNDAEPGKDVRKRPQVGADDGIENRVRDAERKPAHLRNRFGRTRPAPVGFRRTFVQRWTRRTSRHVGHATSDTMSRILIVEDDNDIAALIAHYLEKAGYTLRDRVRRRAGADRGEGNAARSRHPRFDAAGTERPRSLQGTPRRQPHGGAAHPHADGSRRRVGAHSRTRFGRRRLRREAVQPERADGARARAAAPHRRRRRPRSASCAAGRSASTSNATPCRTTATTCG